MTLKMDIEYADNVLTVSSKDRFAEEDLDIEYASDNVLTVSSKDSEPFKDSTEPEYVHKGIAVRKFTKKFSLKQ